MKLLIPAQALVTNLNTNVTHILQTSATMCCDSNANELNYSHHKA